MYPEDAVNTEMQAEKAYYGDKASPAAEPYPQAVCGLGAQVAGKSMNPYSLQEEAAKRALNHHEQAQKAQSAAVFFANNPAFEDFIRLVRSGAIQF